jgi:hypothetical protein
VDLLSASFLDDKIAWYENLDGAGSFGIQQVISSADGAWQALAADLDADGDLDLLSASEFDDTIAWHENRTIRRSALFSAEIVISETIDFAFVVSAADLDRDGDLDVFTSGLISALAWYPNTNGAETFGPRQEVTGFGCDRSATAPDMDRDGDADLLAACAGLDEVRWFPNTDGAGTFGAKQVITTLADVAFVAVSADLDGDGDLDVVSASATDRKIAWYENTDGAGAFGPQQLISTIAFIWHDSVTVADLDGDGDLDVLSADSWPETIAWHENIDGAGTFGPERVIEETDFKHRNVPVAADIDGDGDLDVLATSRDVDSIVWYENTDGSGTFGPEQLITTAADGVIWTRAADLDRDGDLDVLSASPNDDKMAWYENTDGAGAFGPQRVIATTADGAFSGFSADLDGDGDLDVLSASRLDDKIAWYENRGGQFGLPTLDSAPYAIVDALSDDLLAIDVTHLGRTGDSDIELTQLALRLEDEFGTPLTTGQANALIQTLAIYRDDGSGVFEQGTDLLATSVGPLSLAAGLQTIGFSNGDTSVQVAQGDPQRFFAVATLTADASSQTIDRFKIVHAPEDGGAAEDRDFDLALELEFSAEVASGLTPALSSGGDEDGDSLSNLEELTLHGTNPFVLDTDGDGLLDGFEVSNGFDPLVAGDESGDPDLDGLDNLAEQAAGSNPNAADTDADGLDDGAEVALGTSPTNPDHDGDGVCDGNGTGGGSCTAGPDNCPFELNPGQANSDALEAGDDCQCGDVTGGDGMITAADVARARENLVGAMPGGSFDADRCDVNATPGCDIGDIYVLERIAAGQLATVENTCADYFSP